MTKEKLINQLTTDSGGNVLEEPKKPINGNNLVITQRVIDGVYDKQIKRYQEARKRAENIAERIWPDIEKYRAEGFINGFDASI